LVFIQNAEVGQVDKAEKTGSNLTITIVEQGADRRYRTRFNVIDHGFAEGDRIVVRDHVGIIEEYDYNGVWFVGDNVSTNYFEINYGGDEDAVYDPVKAGLDRTGETAVPSPVMVRGDALTEVWEFFYYPAFGVARGTLPLIATIFQMHEYGSNSYMSYKDGLCATDQGRINLLPFSGFTYAGGSNIYGTRASIINANDAIADNAGRYGIWAYSNTHINARRAFASNCGWAAIENSVAHTNGYDASGQSVGSGIISTRSSMINAEGAFVHNSVGDNIVAEGEMMAQIVKIKQQE